MGELCVNCKKELNASIEPPKNSWDIICTQCSKAATVPFEPKQGWATYCKECYSKRRG